MDTSEPTSISIVLATRNGARFVEQQIQSLLNQDLMPAELIVGDDASTDDTLDIIRKVTAGSGLNVRIFQNAPALGFRENFLKHALYAESEFIAFCDQDDIWQGDKLRKCAAMFAAQPDVLLVAHTARLMDAQSQALGMFRQGIKRTCVKPALSYDPWKSFWGFSMMFRRDVLHLIDTTQRFIDYIEPHELIAHDRWAMFLCQMLGSIAEIDEPLVNYRQHEGNQFGYKKRVPVDVKARSAVYIRATEQMIHLIETFPDQKSARYPQFDRTKSLRFLSSALEQLRSRDRIYNSPGPAAATARLLKCIGSGHYRSVHDGHVRWTSLARDIQAAASQCIPIG